MSHCNDLIIINGIPYSIKNLNLVFNDICSAIGFDANSTSCNTFHVKSGAVIVKFISFNAKDFFFRKYLNFKNLNL